MNQNSERFSAYKKIFKGYRTVFDWVLVASYVVIVLSTLLQVFFRYVINKPLLWSEELARYMGIINTMLALGAVSRANGHIKIDFFASLFNEKGREALSYIVIILEIVISCFCIVYGYKFTMLNPALQSPAMHWPMYIIYGSIFVGFINLVIMDICRLFEKIAGIETEE